MAGQAMDLQALRAAVARLPGWTLEGGQRLTKVFTFPDFAGALAFVNQVGAAAEALNHHPDIVLSWGRVSVTTWSHDIGGLSQRDLDLAERIETLPSS